MLKLLITNIAQYLKEVYQLSKLQRKFPNCRFYMGAKIHNSTFEGFNVLFMNVTVGNSSLGKHSYIQKNSTVFNAEIGSFCSIASKVSIGPGLHVTSGISTHPAFFLKNTPLVKTFAEVDTFVPYKKTLIGHDVWIGENAIIMDGVTVGTGAIIASGSIVTKDVEPYAIVGGVPAKVIKYRFSPAEIEQLLKSEWWKLPDQWFAENCAAMASISSFILTQQSTYDSK